MTRATVSETLLPSSNLDPTCFQLPDANALAERGVSTRPPRFLLLYGSLHERSYSKLLTPERHGAMTGIMKSQIDWIPLSEGAVRPSWISSCAPNG